MKVLITATKKKYMLYGATGRQMLEAKGYELLYNESGQKRIPREELEHILPEIDAAIVSNDPWNEELFCKAPKLQVIAKYGVGVDNIDCGKAKEYGIKVLTAKTGNSQAVAELTIALILNVLRRLPMLDAQAKQVGWYRYMGEEFCGKTLGLLGFGDIGQRVAAIAGAFGAEVVAFDPFPNREKAEQLKVDLLQMEEVLRRSDIISIHMPALPETRHIMNRERFSLMKDGAYFVNTARGSLVEEDALCNVLDAGKLGGAALDVFAREPLTGEERVLHTERLITIPHAGAETKEAYGTISRLTAQGVIDVFEGRTPANWVNP